ncbi:diaminopimelate epimerase [Robbsia andropogonis]|uniref:diaminopimelate epimerase n=1 Tax=Robbsia andropogonis TaxID=28092 RepID=UPI000467100C|nr:diaminopimelate epimerase [Robbsia andropogonis]MCP1117757.1 diaminopimelate epimerase [Robbsia andropogonis]MCP1127222.1 diaminopimelate epimerase [Robbsia andropogonis]
MKLPFSKMHGAGNDFVVFDATHDALSLSEAQIRAIADRHFGVGADQILFVEQPTIDGVDFRYRIFNSDGGEVEHCGNGARCFYRFVKDHGLTDKDQVRVQVRRGVIVLTMQENGDVVVDMGVPERHPAEVPFEIRDLLARPTVHDVLWPVEINGREAELSVVSMGNPHAVQLVEDVEAWPVEKDGPVIESHPRFPERVNAGFMEIIDRGSIRLRVYERGAGETLACGTGACAAVVAGISRGLLDSPVTVLTHGGRLTIRWEGPNVQNAHVFMAGPAVTVFQGELELDVFTPAPDAHDAVATANADTDDAAASSVRAD